MILNLFFTFFKIGLFTFGGGYAMIPLIKDYILKYSWATPNEILEFIGISESTPGPFAINISTFIGFKNGKILGAIFSTLGVVLPSFIIMILIFKFFKKFKSSILIKYILKNLKPIIVSLIIYSIFNLSLKIFITGSSINIKQLLIFILLLFIHVKFKLSTIKIILFSGLLGIIFL